MIYNVITVCISIANVILDLSRVALAVIHQLLKQGPLQGTWDTALTAALTWTAGCEWSHAPHCVAGPGRWWGVRGGTWNSWNTIQLPFKSGNIWYTRFHVNGMERQTANSHVAQKGSCFMWGEATRSTSSSWLCRALPPGLFPLSLACRCCVPNTW